LAWHRIARNIYSIETGPDGCDEHIQTYVVASPEQRLAVIDPGPRSSSGKLLRGLEELGFSLGQVSYILLTHVHLDHAGGAATISRVSGGRIPILVHPVGRKHVIDPSRLWEASRELLGEVGEIYGRPDSAPDLDVREAQDLCSLNLDGLIFRIVHTPGHASHHLSIYMEHEGVLFVGDAAGIYIVNEDLLYPTTPPPFRYREYLESLERISRLEPGVIAYPHEGARLGSSIIEKARRQIIEWFEIASRGGEALEEILKIESSLRKHLDRKDRGDMCKKIERKLLELSLRGIREEVERIYRESQDKPQ